MNGSGGNGVGRVASAGVVIAAADAGRHLTLR